MVDLKNVMKVLGLERVSQLEYIYTNAPGKTASCYKLFIDACIREACQQLYDDCIPLSEISKFIGLSQESIMTLIL